MNHVPSIVTVFAAVLFLTAGNLPGQILTTDLVYNWDGDLQSGSSWTSSSPGSNTSLSWTMAGTTINSSVVSSTTITSSYVFDTGDTGTAASFSGLYPTASFELWIKPDSLTGGNQVLFTTGGLSKGLSLTLENGDIHFYIKNGNTNVPATVNLVSTLSLSDIGDFIQIVGVAGPSSSELYVNAVGASSPSTADATGGIADWSGAAAAGLGSLNGGTSLGGGYTGGPSYTAFSGEIGILRIYDSALSGADVLQNYNAMVPVPEPSTWGLLILGGIALYVTRRCSTAK